MINYLLVVKADLLVVLSSSATGTRHIIEIWWLSTAFLLKLLKFESREGWEVVFEESNLLLAVAKDRPETGAGLQLDERERIRG